MSQAMANSSLLSNNVSDSLYKEVVTIFNGVNGDPRVANWFLMSGPWPTILISIAYMIGAAFVGPWMMRDRKPYDLKGATLIYNSFQIVFSLWLFLEMGMAGWFTGYNYMCQPMDFSNSEKALRMVNICWWFYFSKFTEFVDTLLFILRKKNQHISFLHVIHHGIMPFFVWYLVKLTPGGHGSFTGLINPLVHFVMYIYYFIAALGPNFAKYIWWKKYLTSFQMVQFLLTFVHAMQLFVIDCDYPKYTSWGVVFLSVLFFTLFMNFYINDRVKQRQKRELMKKSEIKETKTGGVTDAFIGSMYSGTGLEDTKTHSKQE